MGLGLISSIVLAYKSGPPWYLYYRAFLGCMASKGICSATILLGPLVNPALNVLYTSTYEISHPDQGPFGSYIVYRSEHDPYFLESIHLCIRKA